MDRRLGARDGGVRRVRPLLTVRTAAVVVVLAVVVATGSGCGLVFKPRPFPKAASGKPVSHAPPLPQTIPPTVPRSASTLPEFEAPDSSAPTTTNPPVSDAEAEMLIEREAAKNLGCRVIADVDHKFNQLLSANTMAQVREVVDLLVTSARTLRNGAPAEIAGPAADMAERIERAAPIVRAAGTMAAWRQIRDHSDLSSTFNNPSVEAVVNWALSVCPGRL